MIGVHPAYLARACLMDLPTVFAQQGGAVVKNGFGRYVDRLEKTLVLNKFDVAQAAKSSCKELPPQTLDGRHW